jgi:hypothetical protein
MLGTPWATRLVKEVVEAADGKVLAKLIAKAQSLDLLLH